jgi:hypothetical protein
MSVVIKAFDDNTECFNVSDLKKALVNKYQNRSVSIIYNKPSGIKSLNLVDVQKDGSLIGTHSKKTIELSSFVF